jgi:DHA1 family multidrug resistance protein-like MFS transporter
VSSPSPAPSASEETRLFPYWRRNLRVLPVNNLLCGIGFSVSFPFLPLMVRNLGVAGSLETWVGYMMLAFYMAGFVANPIWGGIADHYGRKLMVLRASIGMGAFMLMVPFATTPLGFAFLFVMIGFFNGVVPAGMALLVANTPPGRIGTALSFAQSGAVFGHTIGPAVGSMLAVVATQPHHLFWMSGGLMMVASLLVIVFVREVKQLAAGRWRPRWVGGLRQLAALPRMKPLYGLSMIFAMLWHGSTPVISIYMLRLLERHPSGAEAYWVGAAALGLGVASIISLPLWGRALDRWGPSRVLTVSVAASAAAHLPLLVLDTPLALVLARVAYGLVGAAMQPAILQLIRVHAPKGMDARAISYSSSFQCLAMGMAPFLAGLIGPALGLRAYFALNVALAVAGLWLWRRPAFMDEDKSG